MNPPAGFWRRYAAYSLDAAAIGLLSLPLAWPWLAQAAAQVVHAANDMLDRLWPVLDRAASGVPVPLWDLFDLARDPALVRIATGLAGDLLVASLKCGAVVVAIAAAWFITSESSGWQASPGKRLLGLRVTDVHGGRCSRGRIVARFFAGAPSWALLNLGHALAAVTRERRALHDHLAGTRVELAPGAPPAMPRGARSWLLLQAAAFFGAVGFVLMRYVQLLLEISRSY